jgi:quercetin dioxygenase-like cupin family protein
MTDGLMLPAGAQTGSIQVGGVRSDIKVSAEHSRWASTFEVTVTPGFDVGAHRHETGEELFYVLEGELDLLAFEPITITGDAWQKWQSRDGRSVLRAGPGSMIFVPPGCPHAFANPTDQNARMLFQASPSGHEIYLQELSELVNRPGGPDPRAVVDLRARHGIEQLTSIVPS